MRPFSNSEGGFVLPLSLIFLGVLSLLGSSAVVVTTTDLKIGGNYKTSVQSFYDAEAGIHDGIGRLVNDEINDNGYETDINWNNTSTYATSNFNNTFTITHHTINSTVVTSSGHPLYKITATGTSDTSNKVLEAVVSLDYPAVFSDAVCGCDGINFANSGKTDSYNSSGGASSGDKGSIRTTNTDANISLYGADVLIDGAVTSAGGVYLNDGRITDDVLANRDITLDGSARVDGDVDADGNLALDEANLGGNASAFGDISLNHSNGVISGNASAVGSISCQGDCAQQISGTVSADILPSRDVPVVWKGDCDPLSLTKLFDDADDAVLENDNSELATIGGQTNYPYNSLSHNFSLNTEDSYNLGIAGQDKTYYFTGFFMDYVSFLVIDGNVTIYVDGDFTVRFASVVELSENASFTIHVTGSINIGPLASMNYSFTTWKGGRPEDLQIYCNAVSTSNSDFKINLYTGIFYGIIYAPDTAIRIDSSWSTWGAIRGKYVEVASTGTIVYDEDLASLKTGGIPTGYSIVSWREVF